MVDESVTMSLSDGQFGLGKDPHRDSVALEAQDIYVHNSMHTRVCA